MLVWFARFGGNPFHPIVSRHVFVSYLSEESSVSSPSNVWSSWHTLVQSPQIKCVRVVSNNVLARFFGVVPNESISCLSIAVENDRKPTNNVRFYSFILFSVIFAIECNCCLCTSACSKQHSSSYSGNRHGHFKNVNVPLEIKN